MSVESEQVEAHAAQGYSLIDVARLLGLPFFSDKDPNGRAAVEAFNRGAARWRDAGQPSPSRVTDIIAQAVHSQLLTKEMSRPQLKDLLGFRYDDLNLAIETLEKQLLIDHREDGGGTCFYRAAGVPALVLEKKPAPVKSIQSPAVRSLERIPEPARSEPERVAQLEEPKETAMDQRATKFGVSVNGEIRKIVGELPVGTETDTPRLLGILVAAHPQLENHPEETRLKTYISQAVLPLKGKLLELVHKGKAGAPDLLRRISGPTAEPSRNGNSLARVSPAQESPALVVTPVGQPRSLVPAQRTVSTEVYGGVRLHEEVQVRVEEIATWPAERITEFFNALTKVVEIPMRPMPKTVKRAWSREFEDDQTDEGVVGMTMLYLVSMLHDGMEDNEKEAVWLLIKYLKRMQAAKEASTLGGSSWGLVSRIASARCILCFPPFEQLARVQP